MTPDEDNLTVNASQEGVVPPASETVQTLEVVPAGPGYLQSPTERQSELSEGPDRQNLEKIRDILFGSQSRQYEAHFAQLEKRLASEYLNLREDMSKRFDKLEAYVQTEIESLADQLKETNASQNAVVERLTEAHHTATNDLGHKIDQLSEKTADNDRALRKQLLDQSKSLSDEIRQKYDALLTSLDQEVQNIHRASETDRTKLSAFFGELSLRLKTDQ